MTRCIGIDIGGSSVKAAALDGDGRTLWTRKGGAYARPGVDELVAAVREAVGGELAESAGIGLCCPGLFDRAARRVTLSVNVPALVGVSLDDLVARATGLATPPAILSDANAVAYDLYACRGLTGRLLCLSIGTGVGASVLDEGGRFLHVSGESPGHFGQLDVSLDDRPPAGPDGGAGSLEAYVGAAAGVDWGRAAVDHPAVRALVRAIRIGHAIYRPMHVALAGGVGIRLGRLVDPIRAAADRDLTRIARAGWTLFAGEHDYHAACGVARYASTVARATSP